MIQRKQSLWLLLAALLNAGVFYFDLYQMHTTVHSTVNGVDTAKDTVGQIRVSEHFPILLIAILMTLLPVVTIFLFKKRKRQITISLASILAIISFIAVLLFYVNSLASSPIPPVTGNYWIGAVLPVISLVFIIMAISGIRRDEKLVKSVDRLR
jgi:amino acid transporter